MDRRPRKSLARDVASETALQTRTRRIGTILRDICCTASSILTLSVRCARRCRRKQCRPLLFKRLLVPHRR